jgi:hypothetical protein
LPISPATANEVKVSPDLVRFGPDLDPLIKLIDETPREKCPAMMIEQLKQGLPYRNFLAALLLVNVGRGLDHPLVVLHATNQLTLDAPVQERLLPTFWALDSYKWHQDRSPRTRQEIKRLTGPLPSADKAEEELFAGIKAYDFDRAERAAAVLGRSQGANRAAEPFCHLAARDFSFIGHLAIWVSYSWRLLQTVGWQHAEPTLRWLARSLVGVAEYRSPIDRQPYAENLERAKKAVGKLPADWAQGGSNPGLTKDLLVQIRELQHNAACNLVVEQLTAGKAQASAVWDAVHLAAGEFSLTIPDDRSRPLHANTASNSLHYAFEISGEPVNRLLILLQAVAWQCLSRYGLAEKVKDGRVKDLKVITDVTGAEIPTTAREAAAKILASLPAERGIRRTDVGRASRMAFSYAQRFPESEALQRAVYRLLPLKGDVDPHTIKFPVAMFQHYRWVSPEWRPHLLASAAASFKGPDDDDNPVTHQVREALKTL